MQPLVASNLTVNYGKARGIADVSLTAESGEVLGLLGPNGAGKTTLLRAALDLVHPTSGSVQMFGVSSRDPRARASVTYLPGDLTLPRRLTGEQIIARFTAGRAPVAPGNVRQLADAFGVDLGRPIGALSKGNRQKIGLVLAFAPDTPLLFLDEPTSGLDPLVQQTFAALVAERTARGNTVVLSSHVLSELEHLADRVAVLRNGQLVAVESMAQLQHRTRQNLRVRFATANDAETFIADVSALPGATAAQRDERSVDIMTGALDPVIKLLARCTVVSLETKATDVEELLLDYYQEDTP